MSRDQIRMGRGTVTPEDAAAPSDENSPSNRQGHTIVGGRPAGASGNNRGIPRAMELLIKRAAIDPEFCRQFLTERADLADRLAIPLDAAERAMLSSIPENQLSAIISGTRVPDHQKGQLLGGPATMLVLLAQLTFGGGVSPAAAQQSPQRQPPIGVQVETGVRADEPPIAVPAPSRESGHMMAPGGCLADEPPPFPGPQPSPGPVPVAVPPPAPIDPALQETLNRTVERELSGGTFLEAVFELQQQLGIKIKVQAPGAMGFSSPVQGPFQGRSLRDVLTSLGTRAGEGRFVPILSGSPTEILLEFRPVQDDAFVEPQPPKPIRPPGQYDGTRGIRSDMPSDGSGRTSKGHRPDLPPDLVPPGDESR